MPYQKKGRPRCLGWFRKTATRYFWRLPYKKVTVNAEINLSNLVTRQPRDYSGNSMQPDLLGRPQIKDLSIVQAD